MSDLPMTTSGIDMARLADWIGRSETRQDLITAAPVAALAATLDRDDPAPVTGGVLPPLWHWLYFLPQAPRRDIGIDGHPRLGGSLPPVPLPRRMWAGSQFQFHQLLRIGETVTRLSRIADVKLRTSRNGSLVFIKVQYELNGANGLVITELHDIVCRAASVPGTAAPAPSQAPSDPAWVHDIQPDEVLLFRYSALAFNSHRIQHTQDVRACHPWTHGVVLPKSERVAELVALAHAMRGAALLPLIETALGFTASLDLARA